MRYLVCIFVLSVSSILALAQDTRGNISGTVTDSQGAVIAGATVVVGNTGTGTTTRLTTNSSGYYEAPLLLPGSYSVTVESTGFKRSIRSGMTLPSASSCRSTSSWKSAAPRNRSRSPPKRRCSIPAPSAPAGR